MIETFHDTANATIADIIGRPQEASQVGSEQAGDL
jgi:hypothetical protein